MKKFLTFLALVCLTVTGAWAGNITTLDQVETDAKYTLQCPRGYLTVNADLSKLEGNVVANRSFDIEDECFHFQFVENGGNYYLYNVGAKGYSTNEGTIVSDIASAAPINLRDYGNGTAQPYWDDSHNLNLGGNKQLAIGTWTSADEGDQFTISKVDASDPSQVLWAKPRFGGTVWTYNTTTKQFDADGQTSTAKPGRVGGKGSVMLFNGVGTVSTQSGGDTSDQGGVRVLGNGDNVTTTLGSWAGSIEVEKFAVATVEYGSQLKGTEPESSATVWVNGDLTFKSRTDFNMNDGQSQRWYIGENGHISTSFTKVTRNDSRQWNLQIVVADEEPFEGITQTTQTLHRQVMTWGADISSSISSCVAYYKDSEGALHKLPSTAIKYSTSGITVEYEGLGNPKCTMTYDYIYEGETKASVEVEATIGGNYPSPSSVYHLPFGVSASEISGTVQDADAGTHKNIVLTNSTPFQFAKDKNSIEHWYALNIHHNNKHYAYYSADATPNVQANVTTYQTAPEYAWGFVGNPFDGFVIYNKASEKALYSANNETSCTVEDAGSTFKATLTGWPAAQADGGFCLNVEGQQYVNFQGDQLKHWGSNDAGSTFHAVELDMSVDAAYKAAKAAAEVALAGAANMPIYDATAITTATNNINAITYEQNETAVAEAVAKLNGFMDTFYATANGKKFALVSKNDWSTRGVTRYLTTSNNTTDRLTGAEEKGLFSVFTATYDAANKGYKVAMAYTPTIYLPVTGNASSAIVPSETPGYYTFVGGASAGAPATISCISSTISNSQGGIHLDDSKNIVVWGPDGEASKWAFEIVSDEAYEELVEAYEASLCLEITIGETGYATFYDEVNRAIPEGVKAYYCELNDETGNLVPKLITSNAELTETPTVDYIPATYGVILEGTPGTTYTFEEVPNRDEEDYEALNSIQYGDVLIGSTTNTTVAEAKQASMEMLWWNEKPADVIYVFSKVDGQFGFYKADESLELGAHKAFYPVWMETGAEEVQGFTLDFGGQTVGVSSVMSATNLKAGFDIQGRRINKTVRGINILNGKKIIK